MLRRIVVTASRNRVLGVAARQAARTVVAGAVGTSADGPSLVESSGPADDPEPTDGSAGDDVTPDPVCRRAWRGDGET
jgi:hypothetical protein